SVSKDGIGTDTLAGIEKIHFDANDDGIINVDENGDPTETVIDLTEESGPVGGDAKVVLDGWDTVTHKLTVFDADLYEADSSEKLTYEVIGDNVEEQPDGSFKLIDSGGTVSFDEEGNYTYIPATSDQPATDSFTWRVTDLSGMSTEGTINLQGAPVPYDIGQSAAFDGTGQTLTQTMETEGNRKTWTFSTWVRRGDLNRNQTLFAGGTNATNDQTAIGIGYGGSNEIFLHGPTGMSLRSQALLDQTGEWYHLVVAMDTTQATASDRVKIYLDGTQLDSFTNPTYPALNAEMGIGKAGGHAIGRFFDFDLNHVNGDLADVAYVDGQALDANAFGQSDGNGGWVAGGIGVENYGTNGFRFDFADSGNLGKDLSGNGNDYTVNGTLSQGTDIPAVGQEAPDYTATDGNDVLEAGAMGATLSGGAGIDKLIGGTGNDTLVGGSGSDEYGLTRGGGQDRIIDVSGLADEMAFDADIAYDQVWLERIGSDLRLTIIGTNDTVTITNWYANSSYRLELFQASGLTMTSAGADLLVEAMADTDFSPVGYGGTSLPTDLRNDLDDAFQLAWGYSGLGTEGDDTLTGDDGFDGLYGYGGDDTLTGMGGHDLLDGGDGNDTLNGDGTLTQVTAEGMTLADWAAAGIALSSKDLDGNDGTVTFEANGVGVAGGDPVGEQINYDNKLNRKESLVLAFDDPVVSAEVTFSNLIKDEEGGERGSWKAYDKDGNQVGSGYFGPDDVTGEPGVGVIEIKGIGSFTELRFFAEKTVNEAAGIENPDDDSSDFFVRSVTYRKDPDEAAHGNDVLTGGDGADTFLFGEGGGRDIVTDAEAADKVKFGIGVEADEIWFSQSGNDLEARLLGSNDAIIIDDWFAGTAKQVGSFELNDGSTLSAANVQSLVNAMSAWADLDGTDVEDLGAAPTDDEGLTTALALWQQQP
ncbi:calcium-binding protein, partial [Aestuariispira insulae]